MHSSRFLTSSTTAGLLVALGACGGTKGTAATTGGATGGATGSGGASTASTASTASSGGATAGSGGTSADGGDAGPVTPTVSSWVGTNVNADLPRVDITYQLSPFDTAAAQKDANGYPVAGVAGTSSTDIGFVLPTGTYNISYKGGGTLTVSGIGKLAGAWTQVAGEQRNTIQITGTPGAFGNFLTLTVTATPGQTVQDLHILLPGFAYDTTQIFLPQFLGLLTPFRALRFMEWESINGSTLADWTNRPAATSFGASPNGQPYEHLVALVNQTGKDMWINVPEHATTSFVQQFAQFVAQGLDFTQIAAARKQQGLTAPFQIIVENANETWNTGFTAYQTFLTAAQANPTRYPGVYSGTYGPTWMSSNADLMKVGQYEADRLVQIATAFRTALMAVGHADSVAPVLSGWALGPVYSDVGLSFIKANYGDPKTYVSYIAQAPYLSVADADTATLDTLFTNLDSTIAAMDATFQQFSTLAQSYGIQVVGYEGGQGFSGSVNQPIKHLAQHDARMHDAYAAFLTLWKKDFGESLFMHFDLAGEPGLPETIYQYGFWGSIIGAMEDPATCTVNLPMLTGTETIASVVHHCPKYAALSERVPN